MVMFTPGQRNESLGILLSELVVAEPWGEIWRAEHDKYGKIFLIGYKRSPGRRLAESARPKLDQWQRLAAAHTPGLVPIHKIMTSAKVPLIIVGDPGRPTVREYFSGRSAMVLPSAAMALAVARVLRRSRRERLYPINLSPDTILFDPKDRTNPVQLLPVSPGVRAAEVQLGEGRYVSPNPAPEDPPEQANSDVYGLGWIWTEILAQRWDLPRSSASLEQYIHEPRLLDAIRQMLESKDRRHPKPRQIEAAIDQWLMWAADNDRQVKELTRGGGAVASPVEALGEAPRGPAVSADATPADLRILDEDDAATPEDAGAGAKKPGAGAGGLPLVKPPPIQAPPVGGPPPAEDEPDWFSTAAPSGTPPGETAAPPRGKAAPETRTASVAGDLFGDADGQAEAEAEEFAESSGVSPIVKYAIAAVVFLFAAVGGYVALSSIFGGDTPPGLPAPVAEGSALTDDVLEADQPLTGQTAALPPPTSPEDLVLNYEDALFVADPRLVENLFYFEGTPAEIRERLVAEAAIFERPLPRTSYEPVIGTRAFFGRDFPGGRAIPNLDIDGRVQVEGQEASAEILVGHRGGSYYFAGFVPADEWARPPADVASVSGGGASSAAAARRDVRPVSFASGSEPAAIELGGEVRVSGRMTAEDFLGHPVVHPHFTATNNAASDRHFQVHLAFFDEEGRFVGGDSKGSTLPPGGEASLVSLLVELPESAIESIASFSARLYESAGPVAEAGDELSPEARTKLDELKKVRTLAGDQLQVENYFEVEDRGTELWIDSGPRLRNFSASPRRLRAHAALFDASGELLGSVSENADLQPGDTLPLRSSIMKMPSRTWGQIQFYEFALFDEQGEVARVRGELGAPPGRTLKEAEAEEQRLAAAAADAAHAETELASPQSAAESIPATPIDTSAAPADVQPDSDSQTAAVTQPGLTPQDEDEGEPAMDDYGEGFPPVWDEAQEGQWDEEFDMSQWDEELGAEEKAFFIAIFAAYSAFLIGFFGLFLYLLPAICFWKIMQKVDNPNTWMAWVPVVNFILVPWSISESETRYLVIPLVTLALSTINQFVPFLIVGTFVFTIWTLFYMVSMYWTMAKVRAKSGLWGLLVFPFNCCGLAFLPLAYLAFSD